MRFRSMIDRNFGRSPLKLWEMRINRIACGEAIQTTRRHFIS